LHIDNQNAARELEALVEFYLASGVNAFLEEGPVNRFERSVQVPPPAFVAPAGAAPLQTASGPPAQPPQRAPLDAHRVSQPSQAAPAQATMAGNAVVPDQVAVQSARDFAQSADSLDQLRHLLGSFEGCNLRLTAKNLVFADGNPEADIMLVGEAPGRDEDIQGLPFVGRSGQLLDRMLAAIGLDRSSVYIANVVPWRPPGNRTPTPQETELCKPFIQRQIELADPKVLVFLGAASAKTLLGVQDGIRRLRGRWMEYDAHGRRIPCLATYHPAYLLRSPLEKRLSWRDFLEVKSRTASLTQG